jgi:predicted GIY-YIG superfamily endonuclease
VKEIIYIYALIDPNTNLVRYVGKTNKPKDRYNQHINNCYRSKNNHKDNWIKLLLSNDQKPIMDIIEESTIENWSEREKYWISHYPNLTNSTSGGEDGTPTEDVIERLRIINTGENNPMWGKKWTKEQRMKLTEQRKGVPKTDEWKDKVSKKMGKPITIDGVEYNSIRDASRKLGLGYKVILRLIR